MHSEKILFPKSIVFRLAIIVALIVLLVGSIGIIITKNIAKEQLTHVIQKQQLYFYEYIARHIDTEINKGLFFIADLANDLSKKNFIPGSNSYTNWNENIMIPPVF